VVRENNVNGDDVQSRIRTSQALTIARLESLPDETVYLFDDIFIVLLLLLFLELVQYILGY
jgi:hypothetical protein